MATNMAYLAFAATCGTETYCITEEEESKKEKNSVLP
jgi:hypothetical protein